MHIERTGNVEPLTPRVERFLVEALAGVSLDQSHLEEVTRVDYVCLRGLVAVEVKTLESPSDRLENLADELRQRDDWPVFLGSAPIGSFVEKTNDPEGVSRRVLDRVGRAIMNHLKKANKQLQAHAETFRRRRELRLLVLVNEDQEIYDPHTVSYVLWHAVRRKKGERPLFEHVDAILYLTQRHAVIKNGMLTFPVLTVEGPGIHNQLWKAEALHLVSRRWTRWNGHDDIDTSYRSISFQQLSTFQIDCRGLSYGGLSIGVGPICAI